MHIAICIRNLTIALRELLYAYCANANTFLGYKPDFYLPTDFPASVTAPMIWSILAGLYDCYLT